jgi:PAS domain-containing protein
MPDIAALLAFTVISLLTGVVALLISGRVAGLGQRAVPRGGPVFADAIRRYEFREGYLLSPIDADDAFLPRDTDRATALDVLTQALTPITAEFPRLMSALAERGDAFLVGGLFGPDKLTLAGRREADRIVLTIAPSETGSGRQIVDGAALEALQTELRDLRAAADHGNTATWREGPDGTIVWANAAYFALLDRCGAGAAGPSGWPVPKLFGDQLQPRPESDRLRRCSLQQPAGDGERELSLPFEVSATPQADGSVLYAAQPIDRLVQAESALRNFVQTLSKTFAQLPIGLAVFDRNRDLILFNPALTAISGLGPEFLSNRPSLTAFLDALRNGQRMPEPKNYRDWRDQIARLEQGAAEGTYQELWTLPGGESLRVIGRPHPDGAVAFMFEDITSEISLTRQFRGDLDLYQAVLDDTPGAVAVFNRGGKLALASTGYWDLWGNKGDAPLGDVSLIDASRQWQAGCHPTGLWGDIRQFATQPSDRSTWSEEVEMVDGRHLTCRVSPLPGGATAVRFLSADGVDSGDLLARFKRPVSRRHAPMPYAAAEAPAPFQTRRIAD